MGKNHIPLEWLWEVFLFSKEDRPFSWLRSARYTRRLIGNELRAPIRARLRAQARSLDKCTLSKQMELDVISSFLDAHSPLCPLQCGVRRFRRRTHA